MLEIWWVPQRMQYEKEARYVVTLQSAQHGIDKRVYMILFAVLGTGPSPLSQWLTWTKTRVCYPSLFRVEPAHHTSYLAMRGGPILRTPLWTPHLFRITTTKLNHTPYMTFPTSIIYSQPQEFPLIFLSSFLLFVERSKIYVVCCQFFFFFLIIWLIIL